MGPKDKTRAGRSRAPGRNAEAHTARGAKGGGRTYDAEVVADADPDAL